MARFILVHHISKLSRLIQKYKGLIEEVVMVGQGLVPIGHKCIFLSILKIWKVSMSSYYHPQKLLSTKQSVGTRRVFKIVKVPQSIFLI